MPPLVYLVTIFVLVCQRYKSLTYVFRELKTSCVMKCEHPFLGGGGGEGGGSAIYNWLLLQYILVDTISIVFF